MSVIIPFLAVLILFLLGLLGAKVGAQSVFGIVLPYLAIVLFLGGLIYRALSWAKVPVPFRIPTTCGQEKSLPWISKSNLENPHNGRGVIGRMALEILFFRSLLRNTKTELLENKQVTYASSLWLWLGAMAFHWSMLVILIRHLRLFTEPTPIFVSWLQGADGILQIGVPVYYITSFMFLAGLLYLLGRRLVVPQIRYISLANDYFPLFLLLGIGVSGFWLRYVAKTDIVGVKELAVGLANFRPVTPETISPLFYGHLFLVCVLLAYFPFSKLAHLAGVFFSPTRNMANTNRRIHHANPWDYPVKVHTYEEYEDEFREKMKAAGIPVDRE